MTPLRGAASGCLVVFILAVAMMTAALLDVFDGDVAVWFQNNIIWLGAAGAVIGYFWAKLRQGKPS